MLEKVKKVVENDEIIKRNNSPPDNEQIPALCKKSAVSVQYYGHGTPHSRP